MKDAFDADAIVVGEQPAFGEPMDEMKQIAAWIAEILGDVGDTTRQARVRKDVAVLARKFQVP